MPKGRETGRPLVACEISKSHVFATRAAERSVGVEMLEVQTAIGVSPSLTGQNIVDPPALRVVVSHALGAAGGRGKDITLVVPDGAVRVVLLDFDTLPDREAEADAVVRFRLKKALPFDVERAAISYFAQPNGTTLKVIVAVMMQSVLQEYETVVREAGFVPGVVVPSTLAALGHIDDDAPSMAVKVAEGTTTIAILNQGRLLLYRTLDHGSANVAGEALAQDIYPSVVFFQDMYGVPIERIYLSGVNSFETIAPHLAHESAAQVEPLLDPTFAGVTPEGLPVGAMSGVFGAPLMRIDINLSSQPYEDAKRYLARWGGMVAGLLVATILLMAFTWHAVRRSSDINHQLSEVRQKTSTLDREKGTAEKMLNLPQNRGTVERSEYLNSIFARKAFSWTNVFSDMEKIMPPGLHVVSIAPELDPQNQLEVQIVVAGESRERAITLVRNMEQTPRFKEVTLRSDIANQGQSGNPEDRDPIRFDIVARYVPSVATDAKPMSWQGEPVAKNGGAQ